MTGTFHFQKALPDNVNQIVALEKLCFGEEGFSKRQIDYLVRKAKGEVVVIIVSGEIAANLILLFRKNSKHIRIYSLAVDPKMRGKGLAREMINYAEKKASQLNINQLSLEVNEHNFSAIQLYQSSGFQVVQTKKIYYKDGSDALVMKKLITGYEK